MNKTVKLIFLKVLPPIVVLFLAFNYFGYLQKTRPQAPKVPPAKESRVVEVVPAAITQEPVLVHTVGRVKAARETVLSPEVSGRVLEVNPNLVAGGFLKEGEEAFKLDGRDYDLAVQQQRAQVERARFELAVETGQRTIAEKEWELLSSDIETTEGGKNLALRKPHQQLAQANLASARSSLARADLMRTKTTVAVPFNAFVKMESIEPGLLAGPASQLAQLIGTDTFWVEAPVPLDMLAWIDIPGVNGFTGERGSEVTVTQSTGAAPIKRTGTILRLLSELDSLGTQARVLIAIEDPLLLAPENAGKGLPLLLGSFVDVEIRGQAQDNVVKVPRLALRDGDQVWLMTAEEKLEIREVTVSWRDKESVLVSAGLGAGDRIVISRLANPVPGLALRLPGAAAPGAAGDGTTAQAEEQGGGTPPRDGGTTAPAGGEK